MTVGPFRIYGVGEKMFRRFAAVVLVGEAFVFFFAALVAWGPNRDDPQVPATAYLVMGCTLAVLCFLTSGMLRRTWGITLGWVLQIAALLSALVVTTMLLLAVIFIALWLTALVQGDKMDALTRQYAQSESE